MCLLTQPKEGQQFKNKKQEELTKSTVWKPDNQGDKEETLTQSGRRGGDRQQGWRGLTARQWLADGAVPHSSADKPGGTTQEQDRRAIQGSSAGK